MPTLTRADLLSLEQYDQQRAAERAAVMAHKRPRRLALGPNATLLFEDETTIRYQIHEMLRTERIFQADAITEELDTYNPLIPDGNNWKATLLFEFPDEDQRRVALARMAGIEHHIWVRVGDGAPVMAVANEDLERSNEEKTSAVHFLRFQLDAATCAQVRAGAPLGFGIDHPAMMVAVDPLDPTTRATLATDITA